MSSRARADVTASDRPRTRIFELAVGSALAAGVATALIEYALTLQHTHAIWGADMRSLVALLLALYGLVAILVGVAEFVVIGALRAVGAVDFARTLGRRVSQEPAFDRRLAGFLVASCLSAGAFAAWVTELSFVLVAHTHRQLAGAILCGVLAAGTLPLFILLTFPLERLARRAVQCCRVRAACPSPCG
jgi:hypothetical protein